MRKQSNAPRKRVEFAGMNRELPQRDEIEGRPTQLAPPKTLPQPDPQRVELLKTQLGHYIDIYKHHFDFFLKAVGLYLTLTGGLGWATFAANVEPAWKAAAASVSAAC